MTKHGREELVVGKNDRVNINVIAELNDEELVVGGAFIQHVAVLVLHQNGCQAFGLLVGLQDGSCAVEGCVVEALFACLSCVFTESP